jgi:hypothetical protein
MRKIRVLHLSDTQLSGSPVRISKLINKYSNRFESRHMTFLSKFGYRQFETDLRVDHLEREEIARWIFEWADIIHYHNRWKRLEVWRHISREPPRRPSVIQIHSPRGEGEDFSVEAASGLPLAIIAQYHVRQWPELSFIVPNVVDIFDDVYQRPAPAMPAAIPVVSFAPSNTNCRGWNDKGYGVVAPVLKRLKISGEIRFQLIISQPHGVVMEKKRAAHIGIDEIVTGSYHMSSLEYLALGVATYANIDLATEKVLKDLTGCERLPWLKASEANFESRIRHTLKQKDWFEAGRYSRLWMELHWHPAALLGHYERMYEKLIDDFRP